MLFGEMDSDSLDNIEDYDDDDDQQQLQFGAGGAAGAASFTLFGSGDSPSGGVVFGGAPNGGAATAASGAGAVRGRAPPANVPASSWLAGSQQRQQVGSGMLVDDDDLARQVAAQMARHRNKRMRASQSCSQMG
jgi:hypothetical protein